MPKPKEYPVELKVAEPEAQMLATEATAVPPRLEVQLGGVNSSAPISGVVAFRTSSSISLVTAGML